MPSCKIGGAYQRGVAYCLMYYDSEIVMKLRNCVYGMYQHKLIVIRNYFTISQISG